jgi:hypothetical protein
MDTRNEQTISMDTRKQQIFTMDSATNKNIFHGYAQATKTFSMETRYAI